MRMEMRNATYRGEINPHNAIPLGHGILHLTPIDSIICSAHFNSYIPSSHTFFFPSDSHCLYTSISNKHSNGLCALKLDQFLIFTQCHHGTILPQTPIFVFFQRCNLAIILETPATSINIAHFNLPKSNVNDHPQMHQLSFIKKIEVFSVEQLETALSQCKFKEKELSSYLSPLKYLKKYIIGGSVKLNLIQNKYFKVSVNGEGFMFDQEYKKIKQILQKDTYFSNKKKLQSLEFVDCFANDFSVVYFNFFKQLITKKSLKQYIAGSITSPPRLNNVSFEQNKTIKRQIEVKNLRQKQIHAQILESLKKRQLQQQKIILKKQDVIHQYNKQIEEINQNQGKQKKRDRVKIFTPTKYSITPQRKKQNKSIFNSSNKYQVYEEISPVLHHKQTNKYNQSSKQINSFYSLQQNQQSQIQSQNKNHKTNLRLQKQSKNPKKYSQIISTQKKNHDVYLKVDKNDKKTINNQFYRNNNFQGQKEQKQVHQSNGQRLKRKNSAYLQAKTQLNKPQFVGIKQTSEKKKVYRSPIKQIKTQNYSPYRRSPKTYAELRKSKYF